MYWFWNKGSHRLWERDCSDQRSAGDDSDYRQWRCTETEVECISSHWFPWQLQDWWLYSTCADTRMSFSSYVYSNRSEPFLFIENTLAMGLNGRPSGMPLRSFGFVGDVASWKLHKVLTIEVDRLSSVFWNCCLAKGDYAYLRPRCNHLVTHRYYLWSTQMWLHFLQWSVWSVWARWAGCMQNTSPKQIGQSARVHYPLCNICTE